MSKDRTLEVADRLFAAIERGDIAELTAMWADDVMVWRQGGGRERDKSRALAVIEWLVDATARRRYEVLDRQVFDGGFVQQHLLHVTTARGTEVALRACLVIKLSEHGLIRRIDEYLDPAELNPLLA
jgi:ketosteroid isomerase-like protein